MSIISTARNAILGPDFLAQQSGTFLHSLVADGDEDCCREPLSRQFALWNQMGVNPCLVYSPTPERLVVQEGADRSRKLPGNRP